MSFEDIYSALFEEARPQIPADQIPCVETSDADKLCRHPLVSVSLVTYNHEPWIRQAIESVMAQKTDFEFELIVGEDCSQDRTREICFEMQKKYPDRIRVLWANENVYAKGGNGRRNRVRCRGEYVAYFEGDDYWIDDRRLQKQVDLMRKTGALACTAFHYTEYPDGRKVKSAYRMPSDMMLTLEDVRNHYFHTSTYLVHRSLYERCNADHPKIRNWWDTIRFPCLATYGGIALLPEYVSVYRRTGKGEMTGRSLQMARWFSLDQYLSILIGCPEIGERFYAEKALTVVAYLFNRRDAGYSELEMRRKWLVLWSLFWRLQIMVFPSLRGVYSLLKLVQHVLGL